MTEPKWYDVTFSKKMGWTRERVIAIAEEHCERFAIGDEVGEGGYEHLQARFVFKIGKEIGAVINLFPGAHVTPSHTRDFKYVEKEGNFYRSWEKALNKYADVELMTWQGEAIAQLKSQDDRKIMVIIDPSGGIGKTTLAKICQIRRIAQYVPPLQDAMDFMAFAMEKKSSGYIFDMPRTESTKQRRSMWSAVEQIKNGYLYDKRYAFRDDWIDPPKILVITNETPDLDMLSADRWDMYNVKYEFGDLHLTKFDPHGE